MPAPSDNPLAINAMLDAHTTYIGGASTLTYYDGVRPATGGAAITTQNSMGVHVMATPFAGAAAAASRSATLPANVNALHTSGQGGFGAVTWARHATSAGVWIRDIDVVDTLGAVSAVLVNNVNFQAGVAIQMLSWGSSVTGA